MHAGVYAYLSLWGCCRGYHGQHPTQCRLLPLLLLLQHPKAAFLAPLLLLLLLLLLLGIGPSWR
jgi:hypothetical protein